MKGFVAEKEQRSHQLKLLTNKYMFKDKLLIQKYSAQLENELRKVVRESVELAFQRHFPLSISRSLATDQLEAYQSRQFKLEFEGNIPHRLFTQNKVVTEGSSSAVKIMLIDTLSGDLVTDSPFSTKKVEVVVLHGHFRTELLEDWTKMEYQRNLVSNRNEKRPLLVGNRFITLQNGIGFIDDINFTDNSSWVRSKMFRLGAKIVDDQDQVREAVSNPFQVKDRRGETYQKHNNPALEDEVWRLKGIAKAGKICQRLEDNQIYKVEDLVTLYYNNESLLSEILNVSPRKRKAIIQQATTYLSDQECTNLNNMSEIHINNSAIMPCLNQQQYHVPHFGHQSIVNGEPSHQLDQSMAFDNSLVETLLHDPCNDAYCFNPAYPVPPSD